MYSLVKLHQLPILQQLQLEEALLRTDTGNWCLINTGTPDAIVMGISGRPDQLIYESLVHQKEVPIIRRYSGGGTVYVDAETIFITFIGNGKKLPRPLLEEGCQLLAPLFPSQFTLRENDYVIDHLKIGGNAQYIAANRWVHHVSFLWDFNSENMSLLKLPHKRPSYREDRPHDAFLTKLSVHFPDKDAWIEHCAAYLIDRLNAHTVSLDIPAICHRPHRKMTEMLS